MAVVSWLGFTSAWAAEQTSDNVLHKGLTIFGGIQIYQAKGEFSSNKKGRPEIEVDLDDLDLNENELSPIVGAIFNFGKRWSLRLDYFGYHDDSKTTAEFDFEFEDLVVPVGARIDSNFDLDVYVANLTWNFINSGQARFGIGVVVHVADIDLEISGKIFVAGNEILLGEGDEDLLAPLPNIYASGAYAFTEKFIIRYGGGWMSMGYGDYDGKLVFANAFLEYWPFQYAGFGLGYRYVAADIKYDTGKKTEKYDIKLPGPVLYVTFCF